MLPNSEGVTSLQKYHQESDFQFSLCANCHRSQHIWLLRAWPSSQLRVPDWIGIKYLPVTSRRKACFKHSCRKCCYVKRNKTSLLKERMAKRPSRRIVECFRLRNQTICSQPIILTAARRFSKLQFVDTVWSHRCKKGRYQIQPKCKNWFRIR